MPTIRRPRVSRPSLLLFDTVCIIEAKAQGVWDTLCAQYDVLVPETVVDEAQRFTTDAGRIFAIDLRPEVQAGKCRIVVASGADMRDTVQLWPQEIRDRADPGEVEAITYLRLNNTGSIAFLTADGPAISAASAMSCGYSAQSLAAICMSTGIKKNFERRFTDAFVQQHRAAGLQMLLNPKGSPGGRHSRRKGPTRK